MKNTLISGIILLILCSPSMAQDVVHSESTPQQVSIGNLKKKLDEADKYSNLHDYAKAITIIKNAVHSAEPVLGVTHDDILTGKLFLAIAYTNNAESQKAYDLLRHTLADCHQNRKADGKLLTALKALLVNVMITSGKHVEESSLLDEVLIGYITHYPTDEQAMIFLQHSTVVAFNDKLEKAAFFAKIWVGMESFYLHNNSDYKQKVDAKKVIDEMHSQLHLPIDTAAALALLKRPNGPGEIPYNKARELMSPREEVLYKCFSILAAAINEAGKIENNKDVKELTRDFQKLLIKLDYMLGPAGRN